MSLGRGARYQTAQAARERVDGHKIKEFAKQRESFEYQEASFVDLPGLTLLLAKNVSRIPTLPGAIGVGDDAAAPNLARKTKTNTKYFGHESVPDALPGKALINGEASQ